MLDTKQFVKKAHAISSSTVNVVCAKVTATTTTSSTQEMWNRMNNVTERRRRRSIDSFDRAFPENNQETSSQDEDEDADEDDEEDQDSELDIINSSCSEQTDYEQEEEEPLDNDEDDEKSRRYNTSPNLFEFHFEFGSKRPPTTTFIPSEDEEETEQISDRDEDDELFSNDEQDWEREGKLESRYSVRYANTTLILTFFFSFT